MLHRKWKSLLRQSTIGSRRTPRPRRSRVGRTEYSRLAHYSPQIEALERRELLTVSNLPEIEPKLVSTDRIDQYGTALLGPNWEQVAHISRNELKTLIDSGEWRDWVQSDGNPWLKQFRTAAQESGFAVADRWLEQKLAGAGLQNLDLADFGWFSDDVRSESRQSVSKSSLDIFDENALGPPVVEASPLVGTDLVWLDSSPLGRDLSQHLQVTFVVDPSVTWSYSLPVSLVATDDEGGSYVLATTTYYGTSPGTYSVSFSDVTDIQSHYSLKVVLDYEETWTGETERSNNSQTFTGIFLANVATQPVIFVQGGSGDDVITTEVLSGGDLKVDMSGTITDSATFSSPTGIRVRTGGGINEVTPDAAMTQVMWAFGGQGTDTISSGNGEVYIDGGEGNDYLYGSNGAADSVIYGGDGVDHIFGGGGANEIDGAEGNDLITGGAGSNTITADNNTDTITLGDQYGDAVVTGNGTDTVLVVTYSSDSSIGLTYNSIVSDTASISYTGVGSIDVSSSVSLSDFTVTVPATGTLPVSLSFDSTTADASLTFDARARTSSETISVANVSVGDGHTTVSYSGIDELTIQSTYYASRITVYKPGSGPALPDVINIDGATASPLNNQLVVDTTAVSAGQSISMDASQIDIGTTINYLQFNRVTVNTGVGYDSISVAAIASTSLKELFFSTGGGGGTIAMAGGPDTLKVTTASSEEVTLSGTVTGNGTFTKAGVGTLVVSATCSYTGGTYITNGTLQLGGNNVLPIATAITFGTSTTNGVLDLGGCSQQVAGLIVATGATAASQVIGNSSTTSDARLKFSSGASSTFAGTIQDAVGLGSKKTGLTMLSGTLSLLGANDFTARTFLNGGVLEFGSGALGDTGDVWAQGNATLRWLPGNTDDISSRFFVDAGWTATLDTGGNDIPFASNSFNYGGVVKEGSGSLIITAAFNSVFGPLTIQTGTLQVGDGGATGGFNFTAVVNNGSIVFDRNNECIIDDPISGTGNIVQRGLGELKINNNTNTFSGGVVVESGTVVLFPHALGTTGTIDVVGDATLQWYHFGTSGGNEDISGRLGIENGVTVTLDTNDNDVELATMFGNGDSGSVIKAGYGKLTLGASLGYTGGTTVNRGSLVMQAGITLSGSGTMTANNDAVLEFNDGLTFSSGGALLLNTTSQAHFIGDTEITGVGQIVLNNVNAKAYARGINSMTHATLTTDSGVAIRGFGTIDDYYAGDAFVNEGTILAEGGTLAVALPVTNLGTFAAVELGRLSHGSSELHGNKNSVSGTELLLFWSDFTAGAATYSVQLSGDGGETYATVDTVAASDATYLLDKLQRNTSYQLRTVADYSDGSQEVYYSGPVSTYDLPDQSGWYRTEIKQDNPYGDFSERAPQVTVNYSGVFAGSARGATIRALNGAARDATVPTPEEDGTTPIYQSSHDADRLSFDLSSPEGPLSIPIRFVLQTVPVDGAPDAEKTKDPIRIFDGAVDFQTTDLMSDGLGESFGQTRSWLGASAWAQGQKNGNGWIDDSLPTLQQYNSGQTVSLIRGGMNVESFEYSGSQYIPTSYTPQTLVHDDFNDEFLWTDSAGNEIRFYDFSTSIPGAFKSITSASGLLTYVSAWTGDGAIQEVRRQDTGGNDVESWLYSYLGSMDANVGLLASVQFRQTDGSSGWDVVRQVVYEYYDGVESHGNLGDLKSAAIMDASSNVLDTKYYRYYTPTDAGGYVHALKYAFDEESYARLFAALGDPDLASDVQVAPYAQHYFEYDEFQRATRHDIQGTGGSADGGIGNFTYEYFTNSTFSEDSNAWVYRTIEVLPDGTTNTFYLNSVGLLILQDFEDTADPINPDLTGEHWLKYYQYDTAGRLILEAEPSAVDSYSFDIDNNLLVTLRDHEGIIHLTEWGGSTDATDTSAGDVLGFVKANSIKNGQLESPILLSSFKYLYKEDDGRTNVVSAESTAYHNSNGTGLETTSYAYTWHTDSVAVESTAESLPIVSTGENGSDSADVITVFYDLQGRPVWIKDAAGHISYTEYDLVTGAVVKTIDDVDTDNTDFSGLPSGWSNPGGLHLVTTMEVDSLGRTTKLVDPMLNVTYTVYKDADHEIRVYSGWEAIAGNATGPIAVYREDRAGNYSESLTYIWDDGAGVPVDLSGRPTGSESLSDSRAVIQSLSRTLLNDGNQPIAIRDYSSLDGVTYSTTRSLGNRDANYLETAVAYADMGRMEFVGDSSGMNQHLFLDGLGRLVQTWIGTDDVPSTDYNSDSFIDWQDFRYWVQQNPTAVVGPAGTSMHVAAVNEYDLGAAGGDSNLTETRVYFGSGSSEFYTTNYEYDWRNREVGMVGPNGVASITMFDNVDRATELQTFANSTFSAGVVVPGDLRAQSTYSYDLQGRVYESRVFDVAVNPSTGEGTAGDYLAKDFWYDPRGFVVKTVTGAGPFEKFAYDGVGRLVTSYVSYESDELATDYSAALDVTGDTVIEQAQTFYDKASRPVASLLYQRLPTDSSSMGPLAAFNSYVSGSAMWYDAVGRMTYDVNFGRQDVLGSAATDFFDISGDLIDTGANGIPDIAEGTPPEPNTIDHLVTKYVYDPDPVAAGPIVNMVDNAGRTLQTQYDLLGRTIRTIANYDDGIVAETDTDADSTIEYEYDSFGRLATVIAINAKGLGAGVVEQKTRYLYESPYNPLLVTATISPDSEDVLTQDPDTRVWSIDTDNDDRVITAYDWLDRATSITDQRGVIRSLGYDSAGRLASDTVTDLGLMGQNVDDAIRRIGYSYDDIGRQEFVTSYSDTTGTAVVNQVQYAYDGWGNLVVERQAHGTHSTESVQYLYDDGDSGGGVAKYLRLTDIIYPNGRHVVYGYGSTGSTDDVLSRIATIGDGTSVHAVYEYLGTDTIVSEDYDQVDVKLDYAAGNFSALDRFGRVLDQVWNSYGGSPGTLDEYNYEFDLVGNRDHRLNALQSALDQVYQYDDLNQLVSSERGSGYTQEWELDGLGNWSSFDDDGTVQTRTSNEANEITATSGLATPDYDRAGNMIVTPKPDDPTNAWDVKYDAWNRVVEVTDGVSTVTYEYDANGRRIQRTAGGTEEHFYYDGYQVVEVRELDGLGGLQPETQYVWSLRYIDSPVLRDSFAFGALVPAERLYYLNDANHNVTAVVNTSGAIVERYDYDAYGRVTVYDDAWTTPTSLSAIGNTLLFAGQDLDSVTGLQYSRARWYSSSIGGFISRDPLGLKAGDPNSMRYVGNAPTTNTDPFGLDPNTYIKSGPTLSLLSPGAPDSSYPYMSKYPGSPYGTIVQNVNDNAGVISAMEQFVAKNGQIKTLLLHGHGGGVPLRVELLFDPRELTPDQVDAIKRLVAPDGVIILSSCDHHGKNTPDEAQRLADLLDRTLIYTYNRFSNVAFDTKRSYPGHETIPWYQEGGYRIATPGQKANSRLGWAPSRYGGQ